MIHDQIECINLHMYFQVFLFALKFFEQFRIDINFYTGNPIPVNSFHNSNIFSMFYNAL
jgi:hypothetical protein